MNSYFKWLSVGLNVLIFLPPTLYHLGQEKIARVLYIALGVLCHQRADRSFYLFGDAIQYPKEHVQSLIDFDNIFTLRFNQRFVCNDSLGCKFGVCARCTGLYMGLLVGVFSSNFVKKLRIPKIIPILMLLPLILDGGIQTIAYIFAPEHGFYESNNVRRFVTGVLFGLALGYFSISALDNNIAKAPKTY